MKPLSFDLDHVSEVWKKQGYGSCETLANELGCCSVTAAAYISKVLKKQKEDGAIIGN